MGNYGNDSRSVFADRHSDQLAVAAVEYDDDDVDSARPPSSIVIGQYCSQLANCSNAMTVTEIIDPTTVDNVLPVMPSSPVCGDLSATIPAPIKRHKADEALTTVTGGLIV